MEPILDIDKLRSEFGGALDGRRVALVGGGGFIGHHLALTLSELGCSVLVLDSLAVNNLVSLTADQEMVENRSLYLHIVNGRLELLRHSAADFVVQDAREYHALSHDLSRFAPQVVVHLAAVAHAGRANKNPYTTFDHSMRTLENALDWSRGNADHFVYLSSSMVYGDFPPGGVTEDSPCRPKGIYGALKLGGEHLVTAYHQVFDLDYTIVRPSALYGERCISRRVSQVFIENALRQQPVHVAGDGTSALDFTYVGDLVQGLVRVIGHRSARNRTFNLTYGESRTVRDLLDVLEGEFTDLEVTFGEPEPLMPERGTLSVERAREAIGYAPEYPIERGIPRYVAWYRALADDSPELFK